MESHDHPKTYKLINRELSLNDHENASFVAFRELSVFLVSNVRTK